MEINWIKVEDEMPVDNGKIQKFLVCTTMKTSVFQNCDIRTCYFTDRFRKDDSHIPDGIKITHWAELEKPEDLELPEKQLFMNTAEYKDLQTELQEIGKAIIKRHTYLLEENREDWELGRYSINKAWEDAIKEICLLK